MAIEIKHLNHIYGQGTIFEQYALKDVNLTIHDGEFIGLIGHTGSGKSTLTQHLNGLLKATSGDILYNGESIYKEGYSMKELRSHVGLVFQYPEHQLFEVDVFSDVCFGPKNLGLPKEEIEKRAKEALDMVGLDESFYKQSPFDLSGGQKRRMQLLLILLDEPFSALDTYLKWQLEQEMYKHLKEAGKPVIFVSHNRDEVYRLCDTVSCMNRGKMEVMEPLKEFFQNPKTRTAAILSGCKNISAAERVDAHTLRAVDWGVTLHVKEREIADDIRAVGIRAHFLATVERPGEENVFPVNESEIWEDPFEWNISFRKNAECSWLQWKIAKTDWSPEMGIPKELYLKEEDILLLTDS